MCPISLGCNETAEECVDTSVRRKSDSRGSERAIKLSRSELRLVTILEKGSG